MLLFLTQGVDEGRGKASPLLNIQSSWSPSSSFPPLQPLAGNSCPKMHPAYSLIWIWEWHIQDTEQVISVQPQEPLCLSKSWIWRYQAQWWEGKCFQDSLVPNWGLGKCFTLIEGFLVPRQFLWTAVSVRCACILHCNKTCWRGYQLVPPPSLFSHPGGTWLHNFAACRFI